MEPLRTASEYFLARGRNLYKSSGKWNYLYRAVDKHGKTVDFLLRPDRGIAAAQAFFRKALSTSLPSPRKITLDGHVPSHLALRLLRREDPKWKNVEVRSNQYLNNLIEQDHIATYAVKAIKAGNVGMCDRRRARPQFNRNAQSHRSFPG